MPNLDGLGPEKKGSQTGRGLGRCNDASKNKSELGKGQGKRRKSGGGEGEGRRLQSGLQ
ncbi:MAG: DUF5320 domain-containing protein [Bacteroidales bacterium]